MFVYVPPGVVFEEPIHLSWFNLVGAKEPPRAWHRRTLIVIDKGAQATIRESYEGAPSRPYLVNAVTEVVLGENGTIQVTEVSADTSAAATPARAGVYVLTNVGALAGREAW